MRLLRSVISICIKICLGGSLLGSASLFAQDITTGLVGYWSFDEGQETAANDHSGNSNTGTVSGATWSFDGKLGGCLDFDGVDDYVLGSASLTASPCNPENQQARYFHDLSLKIPKITYSLVD